MGQYYPEAQVAQFTRRIVDSGETLLQIFRLAESEAEHAKLLAARMQFKPGDVIIDAGCGTGALAKYLHAIEPSLQLHLLNISPAQLGYADRRFPQQVGDIEKMPYSDAFADGVILSYVLGHTDMRLAMAEAFRVLKPGGWLFVYDICAAGPLHVASDALNYKTRTPAELANAAFTGFRQTAFSLPSKEHLSRTVRDCFSPDELACVLHNVTPICARFERRATKITTALQFSGGKDSLACLHLWRDKDLLDSTVVLWCNSGAAYPETIEQMECIKTWVPNFLEVKGDQPGVIERYGYPSDVVPVLSSPQGSVLNGRHGPLIQSFMDCCARSLWAPMYNAIKALGITRVIRGQRNDEKLTGPVRNGDLIDGIEYILPIQDWTEAEVFAYLKEVSAEIPAYYENGERTSRDCWSCTAFRFESRERTNNLTGEQREIVLARLEEIRAAIAEAGY
jgi:ubiquinone/menaquinone biosynthesis C-methylase UbiE